MASGGLENVQHRFLKSDGNNGTYPYVEHGLFTHYGELAGDHPTASVRVYFKYEFTQPPLVNVGLSHFWSHKGDGRITVRVEDVDKEGFRLTMGTWEDTQMFELKVNWMAIGVATDQEQLALDKDQKDAPGCK